jgi:23S rRNA pseudouridine1911/1915/1917 synthase
VTTSGAQERQGIVQRLDVGTSGLMMVAKTELAYSRLKQMFRDRKVHKVYHAIIQGHPDPFEGTIDAPIGRHPKAEFKFAVMNEGKPSVTHYKLIEAFPAASLVEIVLETGRTHQIRVHFSAFKHPLVGDTMYGADPKLAARLGITRQWLHAMKLSFIHPISEEPVEFDSTYPNELITVLEQLRGV